MVEFICIDPGLTGAIAAWENNTVVDIYDIPTKKIKKSNGKNRTIYDLQALVAILTKFKGLKNCYIEAVHAFSGQGVSSTFNFGEGFGILKGVMGAFEIEFQEVYPQRWKKKIGLPSKAEKRQSITMAQELFPLAPIKLQKHDGRAEAALMCHYANIIRKEAMQPQ